MNIAKRVVSMLPFSSYHYPESQFIMVVDVGVVVFSKINTLFVISIWSSMTNSELQVPKPCPK